MTDRVKLERIAQIKVEHIHTHPEKAAFCPECGESLLQYQQISECKCGSCEHIVQEGDKFCWQCGEPLADSTKVQYFNEVSELTAAEFTRDKEKKLGKFSGMPFRRSVVNRKGLEV